MTYGWDRSSLQFEWYDHIGDGEWTWLGTVALSSWVLLTTLLGTSLTLPTCFFFVVVLEDLPWVPVTLLSSESIRELDPEVVHDVGGSGWVICCTAASASAQAASHSAVEGLPISGEGAWLVEHGMGLTVGPTKLAKRRRNSFQGLYRTSMGQEDFTLLNLLFILVKVPPIPDVLHILYCFILIISQYGPIEFSLPSLTYSGFTSSYLRASLCSPYPIFPG